MTSPPSLWTSVVFALAALLATPSVAADDAGAAAAGSEASDAREGEAAAPEPIPTLVIDLESTGVGKDKARLVTDLLGQSVARWPELTVTTTNDVRRALDFEAEREALGCDPDSSCLASIAGSFGAKYLVTGSLGTLGQVLIVQLNLFDADEAKVVSRSKREVTNTTQLSQELDAAVADLFEPVVGPPPQTESPPDEIAEAPSKPATAEPPAEEPTAAAVVEETVATAPPPSTGVSWVAVTSASVGVAAAALSVVCLSVAALPVVGFFSVQSQIGDAEQRFLGGDQGAFAEARDLQTQADQMNLLWKTVGTPALSIGGLMAVVAAGAAVTTVVFLVSPGGAE